MYYAPVNKISDILGCFGITTVICNPTLCAFDSFFKVSFSLFGHGMGIFCSVLFKELIIIILFDIFL